MIRLAWLGATALAITLTVAPLGAESSATSMGWVSKEAKGNYRDCVRIATAGKASQLPRNIGIGNLCAAIEDAWKLRFVEQFDTKLNVVKVTFGAATPNCDDQENRPADIDPSAVARLLSIPDLLPSHYSGGLALHKIRFKEAFALYNASVNTPVAFVDAAFCGGRIDRSIIGMPALRDEEEQSNGKTAIFLNSVLFKKRFMISRSTIQGDVIIPSSQFDDSLAFLNINREAINNPENSKFSLTVHNSTIDRSLVLQGGVFADIVSIRSNSIGSLLVTHNTEFRGTFKLEDNEIGVAWIWGAKFRGKTRIAGNRFKGSLRIWGVGFSQAKEAQSEPEIASNQVGGQLILGMIAEDENVERITLESNEVQGDAYINLPNNWWGTIDFTNFRSNAVLWIEQQNGSALVSSLTSPCDPISGATNWRKAPLNLIFDVVNVAILKWDISIGCNYRWTGNGLRYEHWEPSDNYLTSVNQSKDAIWEALKTWRHTMAEPDVDALNYMAGYLKSRGRYSESRTILEEAKRLNYVKGIPTETNSPDFSGFVACVSQWNIRCMTSYVLYVLLYPGGYGAFPERVFKFIFFGWLIFGSLYKVYSWCQSPIESVMWPVRLIVSLLQFGGKIINWIVNRIQLMWRWIRERIYKGIRRLFWGWAPAARIPVAAGRPDDQTDVPGFMHFDVHLHPPKFSIWRYSLDAMLPVINLHAYDRYYLKTKFLRWTAAFQHILGWWLISVFLASATIL